MMVSTAMGLLKMQCVLLEMWSINMNPAMGIAIMKRKRSRLIHLTSSSVNSLAATTATDAAMSVPITTGNVYAGT